ncbi:FHA domain-containing protein [Streptomyces tagetis]|uniref:FHA domain-containing protein n=1 Tax=Streptomyces tagetis TaxID=2820809 RepID=A0A940XQ21_9ACTN|nr:FHA domain-containing protein [Streptomyces sp. RG38]MBQ0828965.1 FHA domain-containing protein [Streptomyces sp. RG38]
MQIRLTVVDPLGPGPSGPPGRGAVASRDALVTAPAGTALAAVASALAAAVPGGDGPGSGPVVLYAGAQRLDARRCTLGEPPLTDGAVLTLGAPGEPDPHAEPAGAAAQLHVVAGPDAGGVHLLHGGQIRLGRSADADVALDDPDVSRMHCAVTLSPDGRVRVADLGSTNGTTLDGVRVGERPVRFAPGALLRIGESALRLVDAAGPSVARVATTPDGEGHIRVPAPPPGGGTAPASAPGGGDTPDAPTHHAYGGAEYGTAGHGVSPHGAPGHGTPGSGRQGSGTPGSGTGAYGTPGHGTGAYGTRGFDTPGHGTAAYDTPGHGTGGVPGGQPVVPGQGGAPRIENHGGPPRATSLGATPPADPGGFGDPGEGTGRKGTPLRGTDVPRDVARGGHRDTPEDAHQGTRRRGGLGAWARRLTGVRGPQDAAGPDAYTADDEEAASARRPTGPSPAPETWPDPAALLLTALGPGPRLWERGPGHPEALAVRLGTADRPAPGTGIPLPAVPVTAGLREAGALGLAGPRERLAGLARSVVAQLAALHSPDVLEIVLISADRSRSLAEREAEWSWLGWLPHLRPGHGQDCRLLFAYDREQSAARAQELLRRLDDHLADTRDTRDTRDAGDARNAGDMRGTSDAGASGGTGGSGGSAGPAGAGAIPAQPVPGTAAPAATPATAPSPAPLGGPADPEGGAAGPYGFAGPFTVVVVDGDPGGAEEREALVRLAVEGPRAGVHVVCLAETPAASPTSPVTRTYEAACAVSPVFRRCGAVALLSGDVATALRLLRVPPYGTSPGGPAGHGTLGTVDAVSPAWAERFARALAPLRAANASGERHARVSAPLPQAARLLDELGLARATPASLMARWADAADDPDTLGGRAQAVFGAGARGPVGADLVAEGPHLLIEGPPGSGRTELLRALVASLASAERPDRLGIVLVDGRDAVGAGAAHGEGLHVCTDVPHVTTHLAANDPLRMREFAQSLSAELKRRAELLGRSDFADWHALYAGSAGAAGAAGSAAGRMAAPRTATGGPGAISGAGDLDSPPSSTLRLRPGAARRRAEAAPPLPRLVVVVDDLDALVAPPLGSPGRPAAGSVLRAVEAVAREGERLGVHLVAATGPGGRTAQTEPVRRAALRVTLDAPVPGPDEPAPGRGRLTYPDGRTAPFQGGRVTGRIPRTATLRPTVVPLEWHRMGDPPARRPVRELGNGPTDLALLASALERAAREVSAARVPSLL